MFHSDLVTGLLNLKDAGFLVGIKVETESEGMSWLGVARLQVLSAKVGVPLILKIGGCEAVSDLRFARDLGVTEIVAPMIESSFAVFKFREAIESVFPSGFRPNARILVESATGLKNIDAILELAEGFAVGVNIGRSDLSASLGLSDGQSYRVDDTVVTQAVSKIIELATQRNFETTVGGKVTESSLQGLVNPRVREGSTRFETRRFVFSAEVYKKNNELLDALNRVEVLIAESLSWTALLDSQKLHSNVEELRSRYRDASSSTNIL